MNVIHRVAIRCAVPALLLLLAALRPIPALAGDKCTASEPQLDQVVTPEVSLGKRLTVHLAGLAETTCDLSAVRLRLDGYTFGNQPELDDSHNREIAFSLERLDADRAGWTRILGAPPLGGTKEIAVSLELPDKSVLPHVGRTMPTVRFVIFTGWQLIGGLLLAAVLLMIVFVMAHHTGLLRDTDATLLGNLGLEQIAGEALQLMLAFECCGEDLRMVPSVYLLATLAWEALWRPRVGSALATAHTLSRQPG
jgi:hypothetical protein